MNVNMFNMGTTNNQLKTVKIHILKYTLKEVSWRYAEKHAAIKFQSLLEKMLLRRGVCLEEAS